MHGLADWAQAAPTKTIHGLADMGELAVRLGSPDVYERRGNVVFMETFSNGLVSWSGSGSGTGWDLFPVADPVWHGVLSALVRTGNTAGDYGYLYRVLPLPVSSRLGFEYTFNVVTNLKAIFLQAYIYRSCVMYKFGGSYDHTTGELSVFGSDGSWHVVATPGIQNEDGYLFHTMKLVVDAETEKNVRLLFDSHLYDVSQYNLYQETTTVKDRVVIALWGYTKADESVDVNFDSVIVTQNET